MRQPFFIVGAGRVGSTLLYRLLSRHPRVALTNEARIADFLSFVARFAALPQGQEQSFELMRVTELTGIVAPEHNAPFAALVRERTIALLEDYYREQFADRAFTHWGEKLPFSTTAVELQTVYPHAKYIVAVRDPRDIVASVRAFETKGGRLTALWAGKPAADWAREFRHEYDGLLRYLRQHAVVRYEDLVRDTEREAARVLEFLGLDPAEHEDSAPLPEAGFRQHGTSSDPQASIGRWERDLDAADVAAIEAGCGALMDRFGYPRSGG